jgi:predicted O-methyltransferase YrrM
LSFTPPDFWAEIKGFLADDEAAALAAAAARASERGPILEIGSYCGKSTICLALAMAASEALLFALDHHRGSEEHQPGEAFHDPDIYDEGLERVDSFREFRRNIDRAGVVERVIPLVATSEMAARHWTTPLAMVFIDGGHSLDAALADYRRWSGHILKGGTLAIHDVYPDAATGGQAPYAVYRLALESGLFRETARINSLALLERL